MGSDVLVSPLGRAPGAVSGVYFALREHRQVEIGEVVTVGTSHPDVMSAASNYLGKLFERLDVRYDPIHIPALDLRGRNREIMPYVSMIGLALEQAHQYVQQSRGEVHVAVTGGRSGMGALAALATNLYGADHLWHLWVKPSIEERGTVDRLVGLTEPAEMELSPFLNPTMETDACELVALPFLDLRPLHQTLWAYRRTGEAPDPQSPIAALFARAGIQNFAQVFPAGMTFEVADRIMELKARYAQATPREQAGIMAEVGVSLKDYCVVGEKEWQAVVDLVISRAAPQALVDLAHRAKDRVGFWRWLTQNEKAVTAATAVVGTAVETGSFVLEALGLYLKAQGRLP